MVFCFPGQVFYSALEFFMKRDGLIFNVLLRQRLALATSEFSPATVRPGPLANVPGRQAGNRASVPRWMPESKFESQRLMHLL
jgi:hypothetical protein